MKIKVFLIFILSIGLNLNLSSQRLNWKKKLQKKLVHLADSLSSNLQAFKVADSVFLVDEYGAISDGQTLNTLQIQKAIDACHESGGGTVLFSKGDYLTGTMVLKSNVVIKVDKGSRIVGSKYLKDYPEHIEGFRSIMSEYYEFRQSLIYAENAENIGICGEGEIYFSGEKKNFPSPQTVGKIDGRPLGMRIMRCKNIVLKDIFLHNSAAWMQNYVDCKNLLFDGMKVVNHANFNNDGIDIDGCVNVIVRNCFINSEDDAMCIKGAGGKPTENVLIENSTFYSVCNAFKIGTDTQGDFRNIICRNITLGGVPDSLVSLRGHEASTGITIETVDGGNVESILMSDITINQARCPIYIFIGNRLRIIPEWKATKPGYLQYVIIKNVKGVGNKRQGSLISGSRLQSVENVVIRNMDLQMENATDTTLFYKPVNPREDIYPDAQNYSKNGLPGYGFFVRNATDVILDNVSIKTNNPDPRPCFVSGEGVKNIKVNKKTFLAQTIKAFSTTNKK